MEAKPYTGDDPNHCVSFIFNPEETEVVKAVYNHLVESRIKSGIEIKPTSFEWEVANWPNSIMEISTGSVAAIAEPFREYHRYVSKEIMKMYRRENPLCPESAASIFPLGRQALILARQISSEGEVAHLRHHIETGRLFETTI